jgi:hypothetical protein
MGGVTAILLAVLAIGAASPAAAHTLRCDSRVIGRGDYAAKVLRYCGEPDLVHAHLAQRTLHGHFGPVFVSGLAEDVWIEEWTYNFGPNKLMRVLRLENGIVTAVRQLGYGYTPR